MTKIWQKSATKLHPLVTRYIVSKDCAQDTVLLPYDVRASIAHAQMLAKVGLLKKKEAACLVEGLQEILDAARKGTFSIQQEDEDSHTAIENYLIKKVGDTGKKIHMGRSRNDQALVAMRLFSKEKLHELKKEALKLAGTILHFAERYEFVPMPGFTHTQHAMPSSVGQWAGAFVESLLNDVDVLNFAHQINDQNPLGSAAGFGTHLPIDRQYTGKKLGFKKVQVNSLYCQNSRGKFESFTLSALVQLMMTLGKIANDLVWFTSKEFSFFKVDKSLTTGSSIMPQKQNLDIMEVLRANVSVIISYQMQITTVGLNLLSGYNKDLKIIKKPLIEGFKIVSESLEIAELIFHKIEPHIEKLSRSFDAEIFAADKANKLVQKGMPFREAYKKVGDSLNDIKVEDAVYNLRAKKHLGAPGNLDLKSYKLILKKYSNEK